MSDDLVRHLISEGGSQLISVLGSTITLALATWIKRRFAGRKTAANAAAAEQDSDSD